MTTHNQRYLPNRQLRKDDLPVYLLRLCYLPNRQLRNISKPTARDSEGYLPNRQLRKNFRTRKPISFSLPAE